MSSPHSTHVLISVNPKAGSSSGAALVEALIEALHTRGFTAEAITDIDELSQAAEQEHQTGRLRAVVAAGGDGTVALVANKTRPGVPLTVLPLGTENLLSKYLGVEPDPQQIAEIIERGIPLRLDAGLAGERIFLLMVGCGFDAEVVRRLHRERTGHISHLSYAKPILDSIRSYQYPVLRVYCAADDGSLDRSAPLTGRWVFVVNLPKYAGGLQIAPHAIGTDGLLDICTFREGSLLNGLRYLTGVILGQHVCWEEFVTKRATKLRIEADEPVPYQLDGDPGGFLPVEIEILPGRLTFLTFRERAIEQGLLPATVDA